MKAALTVIFVAAASAAALAQAPQDQGTKITYDHITSWEEGGERLVLLSGSVELVTGGVTLRADRMLAWTRPEDVELKLREIYLEGNVVSRRVDPKTKREATLRSERVYYDFTTHRAYLIEVSGRTYMERLRAPVVIRAKEARATSLGRWEAKDVLITTCTYGEPHYHVRFDRAMLQGEAPREATSPYDIWLYGDWSVRGEGLTAEIYGLPIFFWPVIAFGGAVSELPIRAVRGGHSRRFGYWVESDWGVSLNKGLLDAINPFDGSGDDDDREKWGELRWEYDYRHQRGHAAGIDLAWKWKDYEGYVDTYGMRDAGGDPNIDFDKQFLPLEHNYRGRARLFDRHALSDEWRLEVEASYLSDRNLLAEFFEREFKEGKEQESVAYVRWMRANAAAYVQGRYRLNDFQTQIEYLPRAAGYLFDEPLALGVTLSMQADAARMRRRFDDALDMPSEEVTRFDIVNELGRPIDLAVATLAPFIRSRNTFYDEDLSGTSEHRFIGTAGARLETNVAAVHDLIWEEIGLHRVRHIAHLEVTYASSFESTVDPAELPQFDAVDGLGRFEEVSIEMRHRLQTKYKSGDTWATHEFFSLGASIEFYPAAFRDSTRVATDNFEPPFHWITLAPTDTSGVLRERDWSNLHYFLSVRPRELFTLSAYGEYNFHDSQEEIRQYLLTVQPIGAMKATVGEVFVKDVTTAFTVGLDWQITEQWRVQARGQYDFDFDQFLHWRVVLGRDLHDFMIELVAEVDETRDDRRVYVTAYPKFVKRLR